MGKTRGVHETTPELRNRMVGMYEAGLGLREIAAAISCSQRTVKRWLNRFDKEGTVETRERCGRKRATTSEQDEAIVKLASQTPITAAKAVLPALGLTCSVDTVRERLHKAGIHNWSPSRKHIQKIPLGEADGAAIQHAVWRPTGTQLGKKKASKIQVKSKNSNLLKVKKKKVKKTNGKGIVPQTDPSVEQPKQENVPQVVPFGTPQMIIHCTDLPPLDHPGLDNQFNAPNVQDAQGMYQHPDMSMSQNWPLDLVQSNQNSYLQSQNLPPPSTSSHLQELYPHNGHIHHQMPQPMDTTVNLNQQIKTPEPSESSSCSNSSVECGQVPVDDNQTNSVSEDSELKEELKSEDNQGDAKQKKKKGGKAKGTLETSVELRNRMIGMSQAGLSTLSIALAINRSERTVKRWLERWKKEGNVQTKERKGRRRITTKEQDDAIIAMATQNPLTAAKHVAPALGLNCSVDTIRERLHKAGIHSWKLGKKQGEGNAVHTVHLWQPSGNRPNRPRILKKSNVKKSMSKKQEGSAQKSTGGKKKNTQKNQEKLQSSEPTTVPEPPPIPVPPQQVPGAIPPEPNPMQFHENPGMSNYNSNSNVLQPVGILTPLNPSSSAQQIHVVTPVMRPDCRMATGQVSGGYSSCMVSSGGHMEQPDPLNYEPYIWNF